MGSCGFDFRDFGLWVGLCIWGGKPAIQVQVGSDKRNKTSNRILNPPALRPGV